MHDFEDARDPLAEPVDERELREILERLGEAEFGGDDRATVGAIVEATGADAANVLRLLGEIRQRALEEHRRVVEAIERRVSRLENRPAPSVASFPTQSIKNAPPQQDEGTAPGTRLLVALTILTLVFLFAMSVNGALNGVPDGGVTHGATYSITVDDGKASLGPDGVVVVRREDGTTRPATPEESATLRSLAAQLSSRP